MGLHNNDQEDFADGEVWGPLWPQHVQTDRPVGVDVRMVYLAWFEGVVFREVDVEKEDTALVLTV